MAKTISLLLLYSKEKLSCELVIVSVEVTRAPRDFFLFFGKSRTVTTVMIEDGRNDIPTHTRDSENEYRIAF
jgi:hypothetical protein